MRKALFILAIVCTLAALGLFTGCVEDLGEGTVSGYVDYGGQSCPPFDVLIKDPKTGAEIAKTYVSQSGAFTFDIPIPSGSHTIQFIWGNTQKIVYEAPLEVTKDSVKVVNVSYKDMQNLN